jgi:glycosyltransferase involved in cell wall biosynthesis
LKVLHVIPSLSPKHGGPSFALPMMARSLVQQGVQVDLATTDDDGPGCRMKVPLGQRAERDGYGVFYFAKQTEFYKVSLPLRRWLKTHAAHYDVIHIHALFQFASAAATRCARRSGVPYIIRPLGVLNRWGMENRRKFLKSLSFRFVERPMLRHAAAMHYTSRAEQREAEQTGTTAPAAVIPLGIDVAAFQNLPGPDIFLNRFPQARGRTLVLFLSRLDAKKGLDVLLEAWAEIQKAGSSKREAEKWMLVVAGNGEASYERGLRELVAKLGLSDEILWTGFLDGDDKLSAFAAARVFVLPSYSENFGIALVEAMAAGLPCVTTEGVAVSEDIRENDAGIVVKAEVQPLCEAMSRLLADAALRARFGANAKTLAAERFSLGAMGTTLKGLYEDILSRRKGLNG